jgi:biopolymer transport protein ExbD
MAMQLGSEGGGKSSGFTESSDINVTPFVDVMLVLLIIFMVAVPIATVNVKINLPDSTSQADAKPDAPVWISMTKSGGTFIGDRRFPSIQAVGDQLEKEIPEDKRDKAKLFLRGDADLPYRQVLDLMNRLRAGGFYKISLVGHEAVK